MAHDQDPPDDAPDPIEDTPEDETQDTAEDDADSGQSDWTPKDRKEASRKITELAQERARLQAELDLLRSDDASDDDDDDDAGDDAGDGSGDAYTARLERQSWVLAEQVHGKEAVDAYEKAYYPLYDRAQTPADHIAALEAYVAARTGKASRPTAPAAGDGKPTRDQAVQPRVDTNRSDRGPDSDDKIEEARKGGSLSDFTGAVASRFGFGPGGKS